MITKATIPLIDLRFENNQVISQINRAIQNVIEKGYFSLGEQVRLFEEEFAQYLGAKYAVGVASGTDALILSLRAIGVNDGDEVIIPVNSYPTAFAVAAVTKNIKLVDIDPETFTIDLTSLEKVISTRTRAVIAVHLYGLSADMNSILGIAKRRKVTVIEDCAQAHGAIYNGKRTGSLGELGCFSFYPTKNLGAFGDAGMVVTNNRALAKKIRMLRMYGERERYKSEMLGFISRLDELQAGILRVKLTKLNYNNMLRRQIADKYAKYLQEVDLVLPTEPAGRSHVYYLFVARVKKRDYMRKYLKDRGIETGVHYPYPIHLVKPFAYLKYYRGDFPQAERVANEILSLPCFPGLNERNIQTICNLIKNVLS